MSALGETGFFEAQPHCPEVIADRLPTHHKPKSPLKMVLVFPKIGVRMLPVKHHDLPAGSGINLDRLAASVARSELPGFPVTPKQTAEGAWGNPGRPGDDFVRDPRLNGETISSRT